MTPPLARAGDDLANSFDALLEYAGYRFRDGPVIRNPGRVEVAETLVDCLADSLWVCVELTKTVAPSPPLRSVQVYALRSIPPDSCHKEEIRQTAKGLEQRSPNGTLDMSCGEFVGILSRAHLVKFA